jgi:hypothetical protein
MIRRALREFMVRHIPNRGKEMKTTALHILKATC